MWPLGPFQPATVAWVSALSLAMFVGSLAIVRWILVRLPADYFVREHPQRRAEQGRWWFWLLGKITKNAAGVVIVLMGIAMIPGPGQGLLTILIGLSLLDFPGKRELELKLVRRPQIQQTINWIRRRAGRAPLLLDKPRRLPAPAATAGSDGHDPAAPE